MKRITIDPITRLEGHGKIEIFLDEKGDVQPPKGKNALRFESFVFDALRHSKRSVILEVPREEEFAPIKNREEEAGECQRMMSRYYKTWLEKAGFAVESRDEVMVEISPLFALDADDFEEKVRRKVLFSDRIFIE